MVRVQPEPETQPKRFAVIDLETGGLNPVSDPILQIAVVNVSVTGGESTIDGEWCSMVRLPWPWSPYGAKHIHHIARHRLMFAPTLTTVLHRLAEFCADRTIVAHNIDFDWGFLEAGRDRSGVDLPQGPHLCTLTLSRSLDPDRTISHRLNDVAARHGITNERSHDALSDARTTAAILPHLLTASQTER